MTIKTKGKFKGQEDYAPYFYDAMLNGWGDDVEHGGQSLRVFRVDEDDAKRYPQLRSRLGERIAFRESEQGYWEEWPADDMPPDDAAPEEQEGEPDLSTEAVIQDNSRLHRSAFDLSIEGGHKGTYRSQEAALEAYRKYTEKHQVYYNLFFVNERGTIDHIDEAGHILKGLAGDDVESEKPNVWRRRKTIHQGHYDNLVHESENTRVWVSRMTTADGADENKQVTVDRLQRGRWVQTAHSIGNRWVFPGFSGVGGKSSAGLVLRFLGANNAWAFIFGESLVRLHNEEMFFQDRKEAVAAARRRGLKVARNGSIKTEGGATVGAAALDGASGSHEMRAELVKRANDAARASRRSGAPHLTINSSRGVLLDWLAWNDPNGVYSDAAMRREGYEPMTIDDAWEQLSTVDF